MAVCLPKVYRDKLLSAFKSGELTIEKLYNLSDKERHNLFSKYLGEDYASFVNAKFEQAMLSKQKTAFANWIKKTTTYNDPIRRDMLKRVERNKKYLKPDEANKFMDDLVEQKMGFRLSETEAKTIMDLAERAEELKAKITPDMPRNSAERLAYGYALDEFNQLASKMKYGAETLKLKEAILPKNWWRDIMTIGGISKSFLSSCDVSFIGRQGIKVLFTNPKIWGETLVKTFELFGKELVAKSPEGFFKDRNDAVMRGIRASILSDPNMLNGKYKAAKNGYGLGVVGEEFFPSSLSERIPVLGRVFKASETAFNGAALYMRQKLANAVIEHAEKMGVDMLDPKQATAHGKIVSSMTGRGDIGKLEVIGKEINVLMFSIKFLKSNFDTLTAHLFDRTMTPEARKLAATNILKIAGGVTALLTISKALDDDSVDFDPRSSKFGQICKGSQCADITGGMKGLVTLGMRIVPTIHDGEFGFWTKSSTTGKWTKMTGDNFGQQTALDVVEGFLEGKFAPSVGMLRDIWAGQNFQGEKPNVVNTTIGLITPITAQTIIQELKRGNDSLLLVLLSEGLGFSYTNYSFRGTGKKWEQLKEKRGEEVFNKSLQEVQDRFNIRAKKLEQSPRFKKLNWEEQAKELDKIRQEETQRIFDRYGIK